MGLDVGIAFSRVSVYSLNVERNMLKKLVKYEFLKYRCPWVHFMELEKNDPVIFQVKSRKEACKLQY